MPLSKSIISRPKFHDHFVRLADSDENSHQHLQASCEIETNAVFDSETRRKFAKTRIRIKNNSRASETIG